ncbi:phosphoribosyl-ATP pyrophosphatase, partial [candidate division MSBL1 archaeon SCGC-AAA382M17]
MGTEILEEVFRVIKDRKKNPIQDSYVSGLMSKGRESILDKVREESMELIKASE